MHIRPLLFIDTAMYTCTCIDKKRTVTSMCTTQKAQYKGEKKCAAIKHSLQKSLLTLA